MSTLALRYLGAPLRLCAWLWRRLGRRRRLRATVVVTLVTAALVGATFVVPAQWAGWVLPGDSIVDKDAVAFRPGQATATSDQINAEGIEVFEPEGEVLLTTVAIDSNLSVIEWIESSLQDSIELRSRWSVFGVRTSSEQRELNLEMMENSKDAAVVVALEHLGVEAVAATGVAFHSTVPDGPSEGVLQRGDVIVALDGEPVTTVDTLLELLAARAPGDETVVTVEDSTTSNQREVAVVLAVHPEGNDGGFMGISNVVERVEQNDLPFDVDISSGAVGGPSAGLAFTLAVLDLLTPGELTGGRRIAATGSISLDGSVGNVGGVAQKAYAARDAGAELFLVPEESLAAARSGAGDMPVVGVASLDEALDALAGYGGDVQDLALPPLGPSSGGGL